MRNVCQLQSSDLGDLFHPVNVGEDSDAADFSDALDVVALTREMVRGSESAYRNFYEAYVHRLNRYLLVIARGDEDAAREALQIAMVRVVRHIKVFEDGTHFWNWLAAVARTSFSDHCRKQRRYRAFLDRFTERARIEKAVSNEDKADAQLLVLLEQSVQFLQPDERELVEQKYFSNRSVREIAHSLQTSEKAIESRLTRVRRKLKNLVLMELKNGKANE